MERYAAYERLRDGLWDLQKQFEVAGSRFLPLHHDLIWTPALGKWSAKEFDDLVAEARTDDPTTGELWEPWPEGIACSRYWGTITTFQRRVETFRHLAGRAFRIISAVGELADQGYAVPKEMGAKISTLADAHHGWLELLSEAGLYVPSATLQTDNGWWVV